MPFFAGRADATSAEKWFRLYKECRGCAGVRLRAVALTERSAFAFANRKAGHGGESPSEHRRSSMAERCLPAELRRDSFRRTEFEAIRRLPGRRQTKAAFVAVTAPGVDCKRVAG
ncbi:hypothetical protein [Burkholderia oklahomensis]|uniref:hypothetical protein n=1 Tax=Burkholderia oklahomensis TaxID=342113 RepID=UPI000A4685EF|nr:hypothetical protein [Burkholderia oklahomensis]QPS37192.1 hypothetical protein I6G57_18355 [Burkholderia oklahomensis]